jgi:cytochrome c oxidase cbb3-type subunit III
MATSRVLLMWAAVLMGTPSFHAQADAAAATRTPAVQGQGGRASGAPGPRSAYPDRPLADPAAVEHGKALYGVNCAFCHGADTRGGDSGPSLLRSSIVLDDQHGELMAPVIQSGRADRGMPKFALTTEEIADLAAFIHGFKAAGYDESRQRPASILVGDAKAGEAFFNAKCASCHSATGDLRGLASKVPDERLLQQTWLMPGSGGGRGGPPPVPAPPITVTVMLVSGERVEGTLARVDDFIVSLTTTDGSYRSFSTSGLAATVEIHDPLQPHRELWRFYSDADIHNMTAFLVTLK